ncbi:MAG: Crp/Fnr family transcriptional regulator [Vicinamibacterales bacterium]
MATGPDGFLGEDSFLHASGLSPRATSHAASEVVYMQGDPCASVFFIKDGSVKLSVLSQGGKVGVVGVLVRGDFFGEGALSGEPTRQATATTLVPSVIFEISKARMVSLLHEQPALSDRFIAHMLARNARLEADLLDQLFNASEKRLARTLLLLARAGKAHGPLRVLPRISQEVLAEMVGTTRSRVNFFLNKFRKRGLIEYNGSLTVHESLLGVILQDGPDSAE